MYILLFSISLYFQFRSTSNPDLGMDNDTEVGGLFSHGLDRTNSMRTGMFDNQVFCINENISSVTKLSCF